MITYGDKITAWNRNKLDHTWSRACLSSLRKFWNRSLNTKRIARKKNKKKVSDQMLEI